MEQKPLPKINYDQPRFHELNLSSSTVGKPKSDNPDPVVSPEAQDVLARIVSMHEIRVPHRLHAGHPAISHIRHLMSERKPDEYGMLRKRDDYGIDIRVSPSNLNRALRVLTALIGAIESIGAEIQYSPERSSSNSVSMVLFGEKIGIGMSEKVDRVQHIITQKEKDQLNRRLLFYTPQWDYRPTGKLTLSINVWLGHDVRKRWTDGKRGNVEDYLKDFVKQIVKVADLKRKERLEREEQKRRRIEELKEKEELERRRQEEQRRLQDLENQALRWTKASQLRTYIAEVEKKASGSDLPTEGQERVASWLRWAREHANRIDPLIGDAWKGPSMPKES